MLSCLVTKLAVGAAAETSCLEKKRKTGEPPTHKIILKRTTKKQKQHKIKNKKENKNNWVF